MFLALPLTSTAFEAPPDPAEQDRLLAAMHEYADHYISSVPNFICTQVTRQLEAGKEIGSLA